MAWMYEIYKRLFSKVSEEEMKTNCNVYASLPVPYVIIQLIFSYEIGGMMEEPSNHSQSKLISRVQLNNKRFFY